MSVFSLLFYGSHIMSIPAESWRKSRTDMIDEGMFFFFIFISRLSGKYLRASGRHHFLSPKSTLIGSRLMRSMTDVLCMCVWPFFFLLWFYFVRADRTQWNGRIEFQCREEMRPTWAVYETISMSLCSRNDEGHENVHIYVPRKRFVCPVTSSKTANHHRTDDGTWQKETKTNSPTTDMHCMRVSCLIRDVMCEYV